MYAAFKHFGMTYYDTANMLLNTQLTFDGRMIKDRIDESSQLSRRIVRTRPGDLSIGLFNSFHLTCPRLTSKIIGFLSLKHCKGDSKRATQMLIEEFSGDYANRMASALRSCNVDEFMYRNMISYINHVDLPDENGRAVLHVILFTVIGCVGNTNTASLLTVDYATQMLGADYQTAPTVIGNAPTSARSRPSTGIGLLRIVDGHVKPGSPMHVLNPSGTEIGLFPQAKHTVSDVDGDVSRRHAYLWEENGCWYIKDLGSTNGTRLIEGATGNAFTLEPTGKPHEVSPTDTLCLGASTQFLVMPVLE